MRSTRSSQLEVEEGREDSEGGGDAAGDEGGDEGPSVGVCGFLVRGGNGVLAAYGLLVNRRNEVTALEDGSEAEALGVLEVGDRVATIDGESLV